MAKQAPNNSKTPIFGSLVFMTLYALGIWYNATIGNRGFLLLWSLLFVVNGIFLILRLTKAFLNK